MISFLLETPAAIKVGIMFAAILGLNRARLSLGASIVVSALGLSLWSGTGLAGLRFQLTEFLDIENLLLLIVILCLLFLTDALGASGRIERTITALRAMLRSPRLLLAGLPALIGLLPMPGGALVSAPLVATVDSDERIDKGHKVAINYWYRHIWECWWPLYPGVVVAIKYSGLPAPLFYGLQFPMTAVCLLAGYLFVLRHAPVTVAPAELHRARPDNRDTAAALIPIAILVVTSLVGAPLLQRLGASRTLANLLAMLGGLSIALALTFAGAPGALRKSAPMLVSSKTWGLILVVAGVQMFSAALKCPLGGAEDTLVSRMGTELLAAGIPVIAVMMIVPLVAGFVTGVAVGFVGVSFPLVFGLLGESPTVAMLASTTMLAYTAGYVGMMLSPIHVCFVVTNEYFKTGSITPAYRYLTGAVALVLVFAVALAGLYRAIL
jgi:uncharacterized protein